MAQFKVELPNDIIKQVSDLEHNTYQMMGEMTEAGAKVVYENVRASVPQSWHGSEIMKCLRITKVYRTPSDDGVNTKVALYGYFKNSKGVRTPAPLVANVTEYGRSNTPYPKHPFMRKSFKKAEIEKAMKAVQDRYIKDV